MRRLVAVLLVASILHADTINHILTTGQSLSLGDFGTPALSTTQPYSNVFVFSGGFIPLVESSQESPGSSIANQITFMSVSHSWVGEVTKHGTSGQPMSYIDQTNASCSTQPPYNTTTGTSCPFDNMMYYVNFSAAQALAASRSYKLSALSITHGESDDLNGMSATTYEAALVGLQSNVQLKGNLASGQTAGTVLPMFVDQMSTWTANSHTVPTVSLGQYQAALDNPSLIYMVGPKYQLPYANSQHLTNAGYRMLGAMIGKAMKKVLIDGQPWVALSPVTATISGNVITVVMNVPEGSLAIDTTTVSDKGAGKGFEFFDNSGSPPAVSSVGVSGTVATITLAATPTGSAVSFKLRYAYTGTSGAGGGTSGAAHGNIRDTATTTAWWDGTTPVYDWLVTFEVTVTVSGHGVFPAPVVVGH